VGTQPTIGESQKYAGTMPTPVLNIEHVTSNIQHRMMLLSSKYSEVAGINP
jgi:hypothetical protein